MSEHYKTALLNALRKEEGGFYLQKRSKSPTPMWLIRSPASCQRPHCTAAPRSLRSAVCPDGLHVVCALVILVEIKPLMGHVRGEKNGDVHIARAKEANRGQEEANLECAGPSKKDYQLHTSISQQAANVLKSIPRRIAHCMA